MLKEEGLLFGVCLDYERKFITRNKIDINVQSYEILNNLCLKKQKNINIFFAENTNCALKFWWTEVLHFK